MLRPNVSAVHVLLTAIAGWVDAVGYLSLKGFFVSFMSGNTTVMGLYLGSNQMSGVANAATLVACFIAGGFCGAFLLAATGRGDPLILATEGLLLVAALGVASFHGVGLAFSSVLALSMGVQNVAAAAGPVSAGQTYVTGTLSKLGQEFGKLAAGTGSLPVLLGNLITWLALLLGVVIGAIAHASAGSIALLAPALILFVLAARLRRDVRRQKPVAARRLR